jgi:hypothetical protein
VSTNLELVRSIYADWERGDFGGAEWAHQEIEFAWADGPSPRRWTGLAGMAKGYGEELSAWQGLRAGADEYRQLDDERVLAFHSFTARGKASGVELGRQETQGAALFHIRSGKVTKLFLYFDRDRALSDAGLTPRGPGVVSARALRDLRQRNPYRWIPTSSSAFERSK